MEEIALVNTVVKRWDGVRIWYPNSLLLVQPVINMSRSDFKWEFFKVSVADTCKAAWLGWLEAPVMGSSSVPISADTVGHLHGRALAFFWQWPAAVAGSFVTVAGNCDTLLIRVQSSSAELVWRLWADQRASLERPIAASRGLVWRGFVVQCLRAAHQSSLLTDRQVCRHD